MLRKFFVFYFTVSYFVIDKYECLKVNIVLEPNTVERKSTVIECKYDLEGSAFGTVGWGKDGNDFYSYKRRKVPPKEVFHIPGVNVDVDKSNRTHVVLNNLNRASSGTYYCYVETSGGGIQAATALANMTTHERDPIPLLVATRKGLFVIDTKNYSAATKWTDAPPVLSAGYNLRKNKIYYGATGGNIINQDYRPNSDSPLGGALILSEEGLVTSIAVDWIRKVLYFTDDYLDTIGTVNLDSEERATLLESSDGVKSPESIVVDPFQKYLFWGDNDESDKKVVASGLDGKTNKQTILKSDLKRAILALDLERRRLYYISNEGISSCKYDGSGKKLHLQHPTVDSYINSLSYYDDYMFWSRYETGKSSSGLFFNALVDPDKPVNELPIKSILDVKVFHRDLQKPSLKYSCEMIECSHDCVIDKNGSASCTCPVDLTLSAGNTICSKDLSNDKCEKSVTTVNSKQVCKEDIIFEDKFEGSKIDVTKWQHTVQISSDHEQEFAIFTKDEANTYLKDGNLVIKPTFLPDDDVTTGHMSLTGCTSPANHLCQKQAFSYNIIPPVKTGLLNTRHAFSFRYGTVTIRAKVPSGDWLYPVLNLHAAKDFNSPNYSSGVMRLASVNANPGVTCQGGESGNTRVAAGVVMGQANNIKFLFANKTADKSWSEDFHTFKFTWSPEELSFSVDEGPKENILQEGQTLREALGFQEKGSFDSGKIINKVSPLDQEFYLSTGLSVGGSIQFPDSCVSHNNLCSGAKPWKNFEVKSLLKFWLKKCCWLKTWKNQVLLIDYISVTAL